MSLRKASPLAIAASALGVAALLTGYAIAATDKMMLGDLSGNEGILVDVKNFKIVKGKAKNDPTAELIKLGAKPVKDGAIIFRTGNTLYIADGSPGVGPQALNPGDPMPTTIDGFNQLFENF